MNTSSRSCAVALTPKSIERSQSPFEGVAAVEIDIGFRIVVFDFVQRAENEAHIVRIGRIDVPERHLWGGTAQIVIEGGRRAEFGEHLIVRIADRVRVPDTDAAGPALVDSEARQQIDVTRLRRCLAIDRVVNGAEVFRAVVARCDGAGNRGAVGNARIRSACRRCRARAAPRP